MGTTAQRAYRVCVLLGALVPALLGPVTAPVFADGSHPDEMLDAAKFDQKLNAQVPADLHFRDDAGRDVALGSYFGARPTILVMAYFNCPNLCPLVIDNLVQNLRKVAFDAGKQFDVVVASIDPHEKPPLAATKKQHYLAEYGRPATAGGWHFLTGTQSTIGRLAAAVGFHYAYDDQIKEYSHPTGVIVLTPQGKIARYLYGFEYGPTDLRLSLVEASAGRIGTAVDQVLLRCYRYDPVAGKYDLVVMTILRIFGTVMTLIVGGLVLLLLRQEKRGFKDAKRDEQRRLGPARV